MTAIYSIKFASTHSADRVQLISIRIKNGPELSMSPQQARATACDLVKAAHHLEAKPAPQDSARDLALSGA